MHHHHHHHHHRPSYTPYRPPPQAPPPPPPPEILEEEKTSGPPRCYYCGQLIPEGSLARAEYHVGHGHRIFVSVCPSCRVSRKGPAAGSPNCGAVVAVFFLVLIAGAAYFFVVRPEQHRDIAGGPGGAGGRRASSGGLTLTVDRVESGPSRFRVWMTADNRTPDKLTLPIFGYFHVTDDTGTQYKADPFSSTLPRDVAPGASASGYAEIRTPLAAGARRLRVGFSTVFGSFGVNSITVDGVELRDRAEP